MDIANDEHSTLRQLIECLNSTEDNDDNAALISKLQSAIKKRKTSVKTALKQEVSNAKSFTLKALDELRRRCELELPEGDSLLASKLPALIEQRQEKKRTPLQRMIQDGGPHTLKQLQKLKKYCTKELADDDPLFDTLTSLKAERDESHRLPLVTDSKLPDQSVKQLSQLLKRCSLELPDTDPLLQFVNELIESRQSAQKTALMDEFNDNPAIAENETFYSKCQAELQTKDEFFLKVKNIYKQAKSQSCPSDVSPQQELAPPSKSSKAKTRHKKKSKRDKDSSKTLDQLEGQYKKSHKKGPSMFQSLRDDLAGTNDSTGYKLMLLLTVAVYAAILTYTTRLALDIAPLSGDAAGPVDAELLNEQDIALNSIDGDQSVS